MLSILSYDESISGSMPKTMCGAILVFSLLGFFATLGMCVLVIVDLLRCMLEVAENIVADVAALGLCVSVGLM